jgi:hypothetical protein
MFAVKCHVALTIAATVASSLVWGRTPYFPIEISRTAASGAVPLFIFRTGTALLLGTIWATGLLNVFTFCMWSGLMIVAFVRDIDHVDLHNSGTLVIFVGVLGVVITTGKGLAPLLVALAVSAAAKVIQIGVIVIAELGFPSPWYTFFSPTFASAVRQKALGILFHGAKSVCKHNPDAVEAVFKVAGLTQWLGFYSLSLCV